MTIKDVLQSWKIGLPDDICVLDFLCENRGRDIYYIDKLPLPVKERDAHKFDQIDIIYQEVLEDKSLKAKFMQTEIKFRNVMTTLWMYSDLYVEFDLSILSAKRVLDKIDRPYQKYLQDYLKHESEHEMVLVDKKDELDFWVQLGIRDAAVVSFYFEDFKLIIMPSWSCFVAYLNEYRHYALLKDIATYCGLFLRPFLPQEKNTPQ